MLVCQFYITYHFLVSTAFLFALPTGFILSSFLGSSCTRWLLSFAKHLNLLVSNNVTMPPRHFPFRVCHAQERLFLYLFRAKSSFAPRAFTSCSPTTPPLNLASHVYFQACSFGATTPAPSLVYWWFPCCFYPHKSRLFPSVCSSVKTCSSSCIFCRVCFFRCTLPTD